MVELPSDLDRDCVTLSHHVRQQFSDAPATGQGLGVVLERIALAGKLILRRLSRAALEVNTLGATGNLNVQGESVQQMDIYANDVFISVFRGSGLVSSLASEEMADPYHLPENAATGVYTILYDPIDGSSNLDINLNVGSIFSIHRRTTLEATGLLCPGREQVGAGYILYGPSTLMVYSLGRGVHVFTLDPVLGEFILTQADLRTPDQGFIYSINEASLHQWEQPYRDYLSYLQRRGGYTARYSGAMVGDFHRILLQGGVFLYPATPKLPEGKLRLLYESAPLAFLVDQAGGRGSNGCQDLLDLVPDRIHLRTPVVLGSRQNVGLVESFLLGQGPQA